MLQILLPASFAAACLASLLVCILNAVIAQTLRSSTTQVGIIAAIAAVCESIVLLLLGALVVCRYRGIAQQTITTHRYKCCTVAIGAVLLSGILSGASLVCLSEVSGEEQERAPFNTKSLLIALAIFLCLTFALQLSSLAIYFAGRTAGLADTSTSIHSREDGFRSPEMLMRVKAVPYSKTVAAHENRPSSSNSTMSSIRTSISHAIRPISSKTRLLSIRSSRSFRSAHSGPHTDLEAGPYPPGQNSFDSWDAQSIEVPPPVLAIDTSLASSPRFLETIPGSPMTSRASSPHTIVESAPSSIRQPRRSRSYSPNARAQTPQVEVQADEAHIHPLFRSDSPSPPMVTPGTMVVAAPNAGQIITERSLSRMRSSSLNSTTRNLSRQGSFESFSRRTITDEPALVESADEVDMLPPIPTWVLSAGSRTSLHEYQNRRLKEEIAKDETSRQ